MIFCFLIMLKQCLVLGLILQIYHDGSDSYVDDAGRRGFNFPSWQCCNVTIGKHTGETMGYFEADGAVSLYHNNAIKMATSSHRRNQ